MSEDAEAFRQRFLAGIADQLGLTFEEVGADSYPSWPDLRAASAAIDRAARACVERRRGWGRKLKRARRLQRIACGGRVSNVWFDMRWRFAIDAELRMRALVTNAVLMAYINTEGARA